MTRINLLPWREERRQELKQQYFVALAASVVLGAGIVYSANMIVQSNIDQQNQRNEFVQTETRKMEQQIKEIKELKKQRASLIDRMRVIQDLQGNRPVAVKIFDEMVRTVPDGVYYKEVESTGDNISIVGLAESNNRVSNLMRNLDASDLLADPNLSKVHSAGTDKAVNEFDLTVKRQSPEKAEEGGA